MPYIETPQELAEWVADKVGVYGVHADDEPHPCRICFVGDLETRIEESVKNKEVVWKVAKGV